MSCRMVIWQLANCLAVVCKKSGLACLTGGIDADAVSFSAHAHCRVVPKPG